MVLRPLDEGDAKHPPHELIGGMSEKKTRLPAPRCWCHSHRRHSSYERVMPKISDLGSEIGEKNQAACSTPLVSFTSSSFKLCNM
jgi:hypothetical protein